VTQDRRRLKSSAFDVTGRAKGKIALDSRKVRIFTRRGWPAKPARETDRTYAVILINGYRLGGLRHRAPGSLGVVKTFGSWKIVAKRSRWERWRKAR
jgi:hypothetical protein